MTIEKTRINSEEISNQMSGKPNEIKSSLNSQIQDAITTGIAEKVLPSIQNTLDTQERGHFTVVDRRSSGLQKGPGAANFQKTRANHPKSDFLQKVQDKSLECSVDSYTSEQNCDTYISCNTSGKIISKELHVMFVGSENF